MLIDGQFTVAAPPQALMRHLFDARLMAECLPGCEALEQLDADRYRAVVGVALAGVKARFDLQVEVVRREELAVWATTRGEEGGNASQLQADNRITLQAVPEGTLLRYESEVSVTGRLGRFALGMMKKKAQALGDEFAQNLQARLAALEAPAAVAPAAPPVIEPPAPARTAPLPWWRVFWNWLTGRRLPTAGSGS
jgi:carbon monoxide dehydrogenase subunit G